MRWATHIQQRLRGHAPGVAFAQEAGWISPACTGITIAHSKSVPVLHASFRESARRARSAGDTRAAALWRACDERVQEILQEASHAATALGRVALRGRHNAKDIDP